ncbi:hypothetical protein K4F52_000028 [Lecanicillium sp. MT-2017a]|nr:hypothetical protein K4F52_000028 [Lecanicillium sp. MT-2017a]
MPPKLPPSILSEYCGSSPDSNRDDLARESPLSTQSPNKLQFPFNDPKAAQYLMHYIHNLTSWIDICDPARHFATEVPKRLCEFPLLAYALLAYSSCQVARKSGVQDGTCDAYYANALRILIPLLDDPVQSVSENTLASIVLLRLYEEFSDSDTGTHLLGSSRFLTLASSFANQGGLGEAASWIVLRQNLYVSLAKSSPLRMDLAHYRNSSSYLGSNDESFANRAVLTCAEVNSAASDLRSLLGIAMSNATVTTASLTAHHTLHTCGALLRDPDERQEVLDYLQKVAKNTGWRIDLLTDRLKSEWAA